MKFPFIESIGSVAVVGATGLVGKEFRDILAEHKIRIPKMRLFASRVEFDADNSDDFIEPLTENSFEGIEAAFFTTPAEVTKRFVPIATKAGCVVVDDSSVYRMESGVPLVVPEINGQILRDFQGSLISTPNCTTTPLALVLKPLSDLYGIERIVVSTYQSVSGAGKAAYEELSEQTIALLSGNSIESKVFKHQIAFSCLPLIGDVGEDGQSEEEAKMGRELRKILDLPKLKVSCTAVRVPTFCGHGMSVNIQLKKDFTSTEEVKEALDNFPGVKVVDRPSHSVYPTNMECIGSDFTLVGRIRRDTTLPSSLNLWVISDNLRKGSALNALQILDMLYKYRQMV